MTNIHITKLVYASTTALILCAANRSAAGESDCCLYELCLPFSECTCKIASFAGTPCRPDSNECTDDVCDGNEVCTHPLLAAGAPCGNSDQSACTQADTCDGHGACLPNHYADHTLCGNECVMRECRSGTCEQITMIQEGTLCSDDGDPCTVDKCDGKGKCDHSVFAGEECCTDEECDDSNVCTEDTCADGICSYASAEDGRPCGAESTTECAVGRACAQGNCTTMMKPAGGACSDDGDPCTDDVCDGAGGCAHPQVPGCCNADVNCDDGLFCNGLEHCKSGTCVAGLMPCASEDVCDETNGKCSSVDSPSLCGNGADISAAIFPLFWFLRGSGRQLIASRAKLRRRG